MALSLRRYLGIIQGTRAGVPVYVVACPSGGNLQTATYMGVATGFRSGVPVYQVDRCQGVTATTMQGLLQGYRDRGDKTIVPVYKVACCGGSECTSGKICLHTINACLVGFTGLTQLSGVQVVVKDSLGNHVATGTTDASGNFCAPIGSHTGTYTVVATWNTTVTRTFSVVVRTPCIETDVTIPFITAYTVAANGCDTTDVGASVTITGTGVSVSGTTRYTYTPTVDLYAVSLIVSVTYRGRTQTNTTTGTCGAGFFYVTRFCGCVGDLCVSQPFPGITVSLSGPGGAMGAGVTGADGYYCIEPSKGVVPGDTLTATVTPMPTGLQASEGNPRTIVLPLSLTGTTTSSGFGTLPTFSPGACFGGPGSVLAGCLSNQYFNVLIPCLAGTPAEVGGTGPTQTVGCGWGNFSLGPDTGHCCGCTNTNPAWTSGSVWPTTIHVNDGFGDVALTRLVGPGAPGPDFCFWVGCALRVASKAIVGVNPATHTCIYGNNVTVPVTFLWGFSPATFQNGLVLALGADPGGTTCFGTDGMAKPPFPGACPPYPLGSGIPQCALASGPGIGGPPASNFGATYQWHNCNPLSVTITQGFWHQFYPANGSQDLRVCSAGYVYGFNRQVVFEVSN
jgi:hypothetical protein